MKRTLLFLLPLVASTAFADADEMLVKVRAKRTRVQSSESTSSVQVGKEDIADLPQGEQIKLPKLISTTVPGVVPGAFGQLFIRGNHANIQYQIDGVQLPDSPSNTFGETFAPRNIDHLEVLTGGIPAEYGQRLSAVVNIVSKTGPEKPGGSLELNYGSYNLTSPTVTYGGSSASGNLHYYFSANYNRTDRGLDTPQPASETNITRGSSESVHNRATGNNQFAKVDWIVDNDNKLTFIAFNNAASLQTPNYPASFSPASPLFTQGDSFGNDPYLYRAADTDDHQSEQNTYLMAVWKHTLGDGAFLQVAPYWKYSYINVSNDPTHDLQGAGLVTIPLAADGSNPNPTYASFAENRAVNNFGLKTDVTVRSDGGNLIKLGIQAQASRARGNFSLSTAQNDGTGNVATSAPFTDATPNDSYLEGVYVQTDYHLAKPVVVNAGLRFDATQFNLGPGVNTSETALQPRVGLSYLATETTKLHVFYGKLFQPAPVENLRQAFNAVGGGAPTPYDIKAERADYYEAGVTQKIGETHLISVNTYRKNAQNLLDDAQLLNTAIAQPINFATGFVYGTEVSLRGQITKELSEFVNYSYSIARGKGLSGGVFTGQTGSTEYQYLDHEQMHTVTAGATYRAHHLWVTGISQFGSGLRTGPDNSVALPAHLTFDATVGYEFHGDSWWSSGLKTSLDVLNITDNPYPISIANGFNGSHYAPGRQFYLHLVKEF